MPRRGLGRGLDALLGPTVETNHRAVSELPVSDIAPGRFQPRSYFDEAELDALAQLIEEHGIVQPIVVREAMNGGYEIVAGERRWRAAQKIGLLTVPVIIREMTDQMALAIGLIENLQRQELNPVERGVGIRRLIMEFQLTQEQVGKQLGMSRPAISNLMRLLTLPEAIQNLVRDGSLSQGHARALLGIESPEDQKEMARVCIDQNWNVRVLERKIQQYRKTLGDETSADRPDSGMNATQHHEPWMHRLGQVMAHKGIEVAHKAKKGGVREVVLKIPSDQELEALMAWIERAGSH